MLILTARPAARAASIPSITLSRSPQRVIAWNRSGRSVSSDTLMRRTPPPRARRRSGASWLPLVVRVSSSSAPLSRWRDSARTSHMMFLRTSGSPPVSRSLRTPWRMKAEHEAVELLQGQNLLFRQKGHVFRHAIDAAEVAAVGHRDPQIGDRGGRTDRSSRRRYFAHAAWVTSFSLDFRSRPQSFHFVIGNVALACPVSKSSGHIMLDAASGAVILINPARITRCAFPTLSQSASHRALPSPRRPSGRSRLSSRDRPNGCARREGDGDDSVPAHFDGKDQRWQD